MDETERQAFADAGGMTDTEATAEQTATDEQATWNYFYVQTAVQKSSQKPLPVATYCYYCHNPVVLSGRLGGDFLPNKVLPFAVEKRRSN